MAKITNKMDLKQKYIEEEKTDIFHENPLDAGLWCYTADYVRWLEKQIVETCDTCEYMCKCDTHKACFNTLTDRKRCANYKAITNPSK